MEGFLSSGWRDGLAVLGVILTLFQVLVSVVTWLVKNKGKVRRPSIMLIFLREIHFEPKDRRSFNVSLIVASSLVVACSLLLPSDPKEDTVFISLVWAVMLVVAIFQWYLVLSSAVPEAVVDQENEWIVKPIAGAFGFAFAVVCFLVSVRADTGRGTPWWLWVMAAYAGPYLMLFTVYFTFSLIRLIECVLEKLKRKRE